MLGKILSSQSRTTTVWRYDNNLVAYVIPLYTGLESCLGSNLEIVLDLRKSFDYQQSYRRIANIPPRTELLNTPRFQTPLLLDLSCKKTSHKTVVFGQEYLQEQISQQKTQDDIDSFYEKGLSYTKEKEVLLR
jgi:hypothetical protein